MRASNILENRILIEPELIRGLPALAWAARFVSDSSSIRVLHGSGVVATNDLVAEGAWNGTFDKVGFLTASMIVGSGFALDRRVIVRTATHPLERLWSLRDRNGRWLANSLPLLLACANLPLTPGNTELEADLLSFIDGRTAIRRHVKLGAELIVEQLMHTTASIDEGLRIRCEEPRAIPSTNALNYHDHRRWLEQQCASIAENASDSRRQSGYKPLATVSRGYDSPACAVLAKSCGATRALTFRDARSGYETSVDDGTEIARRLDLVPVALARQQYLRGDGHAEAAFLASGGGGQDVVLAAAAEELKGSLLFTGFLGDTLWGLEGDLRASEDARIRYPGGGSLGEYRLQANFLHFPVPALLLSRHSEIRELSRSDEMRPWRIGQDYDRPIPRRIAEEAGIQRDSFGQSKMAVAAPMYYDQPPSSILSPSALRSFEEYLKEHEGTVRASIASYNRSRSMRSGLRWLRERISWRVDRLVGPSSRLGRWIELRLSDRFRRPAATSLFLVEWAITQVQREYRKTISERHNDS